MRSSAFIVLEGIDGAGTTTQLGRLAAWLRASGREVSTTCEPTDGPIGRAIRGFLRGEAAPPHPDAIALLFAADRVDHLAREITPALDAGHVVLCDRYVGSSLAYQGSYSDPAWVRAVNSRARTPDLTLYVRVPAQVALARIGIRDGDRRELFERRDVLERIGAAYDRLYGRGSDGVLRGEIIDGEATPDEVFAACQRHVAALLAPTS